MSSRLREKKPHKTGVLVWGGKPPVTAALTLEDLIAALSGIFQELAEREGVALAVGEHCDPKGEPSVKGGGGGLVLPPHPARLGATTCVSWRAHCVHWPRVYPDEVTVCTDHVCILMRSLCALHGGATIATSKLGHTERLPQSHLGADTNDLKCSHFWSCSFSSTIQPSAGRGRRTVSEH